MLFGLALDLALLGTIQLRLWKDFYRPQLLALALLLGAGALLGFVWSDMFSATAERALVVYEALLPFAIFLQLARFLPRPWLQWAPLPVAAVVACAALALGWGFQSTPMLAYEAVFLIAQLVMVLAWSVKGTFSEEELLFVIAAQALLLVLGPGYGVLWPKLGMSDSLLAIAGAAAGALIIVGRMRSSFLHFVSPGAIVRKRPSKQKGGALPAGIILVPLGKYDNAKGQFKEDVKAGRTGLWISTEPVSHVLGHRKGDSVHRSKTPGLLAAQLTHATFVENALEPTDIGTIKRSLAEFLKMTGDGMVFVRDMHYLVSNTDIWNMTELLRFLREKVPSARTSILVGTDLLDEWEVAHLRKAGAADWKEGDIEAGRRPQAQ